MKQKRNNKKYTFGFSPMKKFKNNGFSYPVFNTMTSSIGDGGIGGMSSGMGESIDEIKSPDKLYEFGAILANIPTDVHSVLKYYAVKNIDTDSYYKSEQDAIDGIEDEFNVTMLYGFDSNVEKVKKVCSTITQFEIAFNEIVIFKENPLFDVVAVNIDNGYIDTIEKYLLSSFNESTEDDLNKHCILAFVKKDSCDHLDGDTYLDVLSATIDSMIYSDENGNDHDIYL